MRVPFVIFLFIFIFIFCFDLCCIFSFLLLNMTLPNVVSAVKWQGGFFCGVSSNSSTVDPRLLPLGNPVKYHVVALYL